MKVIRLCVEYFKTVENEYKSRFVITVQGKNFLQNIEISESDFNDLTKEITKESGIGKGERNQVNDFLLRMTYEVL